MKESKELKQIKELLTNKTNAKKENIDKITTELFYKVLEKYPDSKESRMLIYEMNRFYFKEIKRIYNKIELTMKQVLDRRTDFTPREDYNYLLKIYKNSQIPEILEKKDPVHDFYIVILKTRLTEKQSEKWVKNNINKIVRPELEWTKIHSVKPTKKKFIDQYFSELELEIELETPNSCY